MPLNATRVVKNCFLVLLYLTNSQEKTTIPFMMIHKPYIGINLQQQLAANVCYLYHI